MEWKELKDIDFYAMEEQRIGIRCKNEEMTENFMEQIKGKIKSMEGSYLYIDYKGCSSSEDYQKKMIETISRFIEEKFPGEVNRLSGDALNEKASNSLGLLEWASNELRRQFTLVIDFRGTKITSSILRPGQNFWWAYDSASRCVNSNLIWIMDDDEAGSERLIKHGQMKRVFSEEGTSTYLIL
jgi:hypothetical protein